MKIAVVTFPGSNCDYDCYKALQLTTGADVGFIWHRSQDLEDANAVFLPGGFSYGDYLRAGAIARMSPVMAAVKRFAASGRPVAGICNGFQILCEAGLLPGALIRNRSLKFISRPVRLRVERSLAPFTTAYSEGEILQIPIAHGEGCYVADPATLQELEGQQRVIFRYVDADGNATASANPNGSIGNIAGIVNDGGNVLGLMPHPERAVESLLGSADGQGLFQSLESHLNAA